MQYLGQCKWCGASAWWNPEEERIQWREEFLDCEHELPEKVRLWDEA